MGQRENDEIPWAGSRPQILVTSREQELLDKGIVEVDGKKCWRAGDQLFDCSSVVLYPLRKGGQQ